MSRHSRRDHHGRQPARNERGAVLVHVAIAMLGLLAFSSFVIDYGVLWTARRQVQNAADAGAMAAAAYLGFTGGDEASARAAAIEAAQANDVWGELPQVMATDVTFSACPADAPGAAAAICARTDAYRNQERGNPLPTLFSSLVGVTSQGVRATATAQVVYSNTSSCVKPLAILDKWNEVQSPGWDPGDTFDRYEPPPAPLGTLLANPDTYQPVAPPGNNGSGFDLSDPIHGYGLELRLVRRIGPPAPPDRVDWYIPVQLDCPSETPGTAACVIENLTSCSPQTLRPDDVVPLQVQGLSPLGVDLLAPALASLVDADPSAIWDDGANGGRGGIVGGCMASGACAVSPRLIAVPMVNPQIWADQNVDPDIPASYVTVTRVVGLFVDDVVGHEIVGRLMPYPAVPSSTIEPGVAGSSFVVSTLLVR